MARIYPSSNKMANPVVETKGDQPVDIRKMNTAELKAKAAELGIDLSGCKNNPERADLIIAALEKTNAGTPGEDGDGGGDGTPDTGEGGDE